MSSNDNIDGAQTAASPSDTTMDSAAPNGNHLGSIDSAASPDSGSKSDNSNNHNIADSSSGSAGKKGGAKKTGTANNNRPHNSNNNGHQRRGQRTNNANGRQGHSNGRGPFRRYSPVESSIHARRLELLEIIRMEHMKAVIYTSSSDLSAEEREVGIKEARISFEAAREEWKALNAAVAAAAAVSNDAANVETVEEAANPTVQVEA